jgi:hypothetical protein
MYFNGIKQEEFEKSAQYGIDGRLDSPRQLSRDANSAVQVGLKTAASSAAGS